ncbi:MAG TPA: FAD-dependent oxidoreductase [Candidatus Methylomirabilis sp.]|nr:FAD-dependent oxidoreductase [Candidatus Methylomirabilis sp.]
MDAEIAVVGGGIAGASTAFHLAAHGRRVTLVERGEIASGASGVNAGAIDSIGWGHSPDLQAHLTAGSVELFKQLQLDHDLDVEFRQSGALQAIQTPEQYEFTRERVAALRARGHEVVLLSAREARSLEPGMSAAVLGAMYSPLRSQADPVRATQAFARLAEREGARILTGCEVTAIEPRPAGGWVVRATSLELIASDIVIAAGAWCQTLGAMLGLEIPIVAVRGQMWATASVSPRVFQTISSAESAMAFHHERGGAAVAPERDDGEPPDLTHRAGARVTRHLYGRQRRNGEVIFGGDRQLAGWSTVPEPSGIEVNRRHAAEVLPFLAELPTARTWAGLMPFSPDGKPLIGRLPGRAGLWIASGLASSGFGRGPMAGKLLADALHTGAPAPVLAEADPARCVRELAGR